MSFEKDANGMIILRPVLGWTAAPVAEIALLLQLQYAEGEADIETGGKSIQFSLTPPQCLELAEVLTRRANQILNSKLSSPPQ